MKRIVTLFLSLVLLLSCLCAPASALFDPSLFYEVQARSAYIVNTDTNGDLHVIDAMVPLSEMFGYATDLRSRSQGRGTFTMQFAQYESVPKNVAAKILGAANYVNQ